MPSDDRKFLILVVEDDRNIRELLKIHLAEAGYSVLLAQRTSVADAHLERERPDLLLLDIVMPEESGLDYARRLRKQRGLRTPIVFLSMLSDDATMDSVNAIAAAKLVKKPVHKDVLLKTIRAMLDASTIG